MAPATTSGAKPAVGGRVGAPPRPGRWAQPFHGGRRGGMPAASGGGATDYYECRIDPRETELGDILRQNERGRAPVVVSPKATALEGMKLMASYGVAGLPVVSEDGDLVGVVTDLQLLRGRPWKSRHFPALGENFSNMRNVIRKELDAASAETEVGELMTPYVDAKVATPSERVEDLADYLVDPKHKHIRWVPVVSSHEGGKRKLEGLVTRSDIIKLALSCYDLSSAGGESA